jgi:2-polyprenyl-3-methyl-5-hydroxy-6-metoxy-1,4-benzoquinol methylase
MSLRATRCLCGATHAEPIGVRDERPVGRCTACGLVRTLAVPDDYLALYTDGDRYHAGRQGHTPYRDRFEHDVEVAALRWPRLLQRLRLLDVGCANGAFVHHAARQGMAAEGLDINAPIARWAAERAGCRIHATWDTVRGPFDIITYHDVLEHVQDPLAELVRARGFLRPGGLLVLDTPDADDPRFAALGLAWHHLKPREHLWFFAEPQLRALVHRAGYHVEAADRPIQGKIVLYARVPAPAPHPAAAVAHPLPLTAAAGD